MSEFEKATYSAVESYMKLQDERCELNSRHMDTLDQAWLAGADWAKSYLEQEIKELQSAVVGLSDTLEFLRDNRIHDSRVTSICSDAITKHADVIKKARGNL